MNKNDLVELLAEEHELTKTFAREVVETVFQSITDAAQKGEEVSIFPASASSASRNGRRARAAIRRPAPPSRSRLRSGSSSSPPAR